MDPQEMSENLQLLRGRTLSRLVDEIFSPFRMLSPVYEQKLLTSMEHTPLIKRSGEGYDKKKNRGKKNLPNIEMEILIYISHFIFI